MNFNENALPDFVLVDLYKNTLVCCDTTVGVQEKLTVPAIETAAKYTNKISFLGENKKKISIVVKEENAVHIAEDNFAFLSNILAACKLNVGDVAIVNHVKQQTTFALLKEQLQPAFVILFDLGLQDLDLPLTMPHYQLQNYAGCTFLTAASLNTMLGSSQEAKIEKSKLWLNLKNMFGI